MPPSLVGMTAHFDTNSIADFQPALRMTCHVSENPPHSPHSALLPNPLMAVTGNAKKKLVGNVVDSLRRKRLKRHTINHLLLHPPTITNRRKNNSFRVNRACPPTTPIREHQTWVTSLVKMANSQLPNDPVDSPTISAYFVEV